MSVWRQLRAVLLLPFTVTVVLPALILWGRGAVDVDLVPALLGSALIALGLALVVWTVWQRWWEPGTTPPPSPGRGVGGGRRSRLSGSHRLQEFANRGPAVGDGRPVLSPASSCD